MIDLGLPSGTKWACCNVGANKPEESGGYYAWGETWRKYDYNVENYKYQQKGSSGYVNIGNDIADSQYDVAHINWGSSWSMPSAYQIQELLDNSIYEWTKMNGVLGGKFTSKNNGCIIFIPTTYHTDDSRLSHTSYYGPYWSSSLKSEYVAYVFFICSEYAKKYSDDRSCGYSIRPVSSTINSYSCPNSNHPHIIDLGLPSGTKWACCNIGATTPEGYGGYYAWGETEEKRFYDWSSYSFCNGHHYDCYNIGDNISGTNYDVAKKKWGRNWRLPSEEQNEELIKNCSYKRSTINGVKGVKLTSKINNRSIFLPDAGFYSENRIAERNEYGYYWSGKLDKFTGWDSSAIRYDSKENKWFMWMNRRCGLSVRPVWVP